MRWSHLRAVLWLRWRILVNRVRRTGKLNNTLFGLLIVLGACASLGLFVVALLLGLETLPEATPMALMLAWVVLALAFLFSWMIGLLTDLQRSDAMSFKNLLHLPVSLGWVLLYNYLSSFVSISVAIFLPAMLGLCLAMGIVHGPLMLLGVPLVLGYFGMITALTYQLRGWLARLMEDKRRGRTIVAAITLGIVLLLQLPNLINLRLHGTDRAERRQARRELVELRRAAGEEGPGRAAAEAELARRLEREAEEEAELDRRLSLAAMAVPIGWLPYGVRASFEGRWLPGALGVLGMLLIGAWSLRRSYRATMGAVLGTGGGAVASAPAHATSAPAAARRTLLVERRLPVVSETEAGVAFATLRSLLRAPEAKLLMLSPVILLGLFGFMLATDSTLREKAAFAPAMSLGAISLGLLSITQLIQNQFGLDRAGFRAFVLSPVPRDRILRGKNLATAPLGIGVGLVALIGLQAFLPVDLPHFLGGCLQLVSAYLLMSLVGNTISILGPMRLKENAMKAAKVDLKTVLWQLLSLLLVPITLAPLLLPWGLELFFRAKGWGAGLPLYLLMHAAGAVAVLLGYRWLVRRQGALLQDREQHILDVLTHD